MAEMDLVSRTLGQYKIIEEIGRGGMATVYKAYQPSLNRYVAIKVLPPYLAHDEEFIRRFDREARAAARLKHPNIVIIHDVGEEEGIHYMVMEYLEGRSLKEVIEREGPLPPERAARIIKQIADALDYAHRRGFVHRDIKPSNIIIGEGDHITITDFGIVKAAAETRLTKTGMLLGTPEYMSPEQARGEEVDHRTDIYSLGVVAYKMLTGRSPFSADTPHAVLYQHVHENPPPLRSFNPRLPEAVEQVVERALAKDRGARYQKAGNLAGALDKASKGMLVEEAPTIAQAPAAQPIPRRRGFPTMALLSGLAALLFIVIGMLIIGRAPTSTPTPHPVAIQATPTVTPVASTPTTLPPTATFTPQPTPTPRPTATPTSLPSPTPTCRLAVDSRLASAWDRNKFGCPTTHSKVTWAAWEPFERGYMLWRSDTHRITVFYDDGTWLELPDQWDGQPIPSRGSPPPGRVAPVRGFGYIWGTHDEVANRLGWALEEEKGFCAEIQSFEQGFILRGGAVRSCIDEKVDEPRTTHPLFTPLFFAVYGDGTWQRH